MNHGLSDVERDRIISEWVQNYGVSIKRICILYLSDLQMAEDAVQETFIKAWKYMDQFEGRGDSKVSTWLTRIAINTCHDVHRSRWYRNVDTTIDAESVLKLHGGMSDSDRTLLLDVLRLPEKEKTAILLYYYQGMTQHEIAQTLGVSRTSVQLTLKKALTRLKVEWKEDEPQ